MAATHQLLLYEYVEDVLERRVPHREAHLALIREWRERGLIALAGAVGDPPRGAAIAFATDRRATVEEFVRADPYVAAELVRDWRIEPYAVV